METGNFFHNVDGVLDGKGPEHQVVKEKDTEQKIKEAAKKVFQQKGFAGTRTRDIAEEAGINLALLNYYFRSKKKLYEIIMLESLREFFAGVLLILVGLVIPLT